MRKTVKTPAADFTCDVYLNPVFSDDDAPLVVGLLRFTPGARNAAANNTDAITA
jgi:hypothetical protein